MKKRFNLLSAFFKQIVNILSSRIGLSLTVVNVLLLSTGCSTLPSSTAIFNQSIDNVVQFVDFPAERRGAWIIKTDVQSSGTKTVSGYKVCAEPPTDAGLSTTQLLNLSADLKKLADTKVGFDSSTASNLYELKGRTPAVLALRDVMYRMCEGRLHRPDVGDDVIKNEQAIYADIVKVIGKFAAAELEAAEEQKARAIGVKSKLENAVAKENEGIAAVGKKEWGVAQIAFEECEKIYPQFRACYEFSNDLKAKSNDTDKKKAEALLKRESFFPNRIRDMLKEIK